MLGQEIECRKGARVHRTRAPSGCEGFSALLIASIPLARGNRVFGMLATIPTEGLPLVDLIFGEVALLVAPNVAGIAGIRIDLLTLLHHRALLLQRYAASSV